MKEHELWVTALFNRFLAGPANTVLGLVGVKPENAAHPWSNFVAMEIMVALIVVLVFGVLRPRMSIDRPGKLQHVIEIFYNFLREQAEESIGHRGTKYLPFFGTLFFFILFMNLIGLVPTLESPTMFAAVPLGCALATFGYYNMTGFREAGLGYLKHFAGPMPALGFIMVPIEMVSHLARPLSLTIRLYANMFAGEAVTMAFMGLIPLIIPIPFMGLHIFVALLQAYIFTLLTMIYVGEALPHEAH